MKASEVMRKEIVTVTPRTAISDAVRLMLDHRISGLPVIDESGAVAGMVTEGDLLRRVELGTEKRVPAWRAWLMASGRDARDFVLSHGRQVGEIMTAPVAWVAPDADLTEVVALMESRRIKRIPVLDGGRLVGMVARADLLRALELLLPRAAVSPVADAELRHRVLTSLEAQPWVRGDTSVDVRVKDGIVELVGVVTDQRERAAIRVVAENTPGVRGVVDHVLWVEGLSGLPVDPPPGFST
jgi:CBS domain-containing protein